MMPTYFGMEVWSDSYWQEFNTEDKTFYMKMQNNISILYESPLRNHDGIIHSDPTNKANILNHQFKSAFTKEDLSNIPSKGCSHFHDRTFIKVTSPGVEKLLHNLCPHKATGPDSIPARLLKELSTELAPALTFIFEMSLDAGCVPSDWKLAHIVPLFKKGDKSAAASYTQFPWQPYAPKLWNTFYTRASWVTWKTTRY